MHYNYHGRIKQRIEAGELTGHEIVSNHPRIKGQVLMLYFNTHPYERPIRPHAFTKYEHITNQSEL